MEQISYMMHEADMARMERTNKRLWILIIILIVALIGSNAGWIYYESQFDYFETSVTQESDSGYNNYIGGSGLIKNGQTDSNY